MTATKQWRKLGCIHFLRLKKQNKQGRREAAAKIWAFSIWPPRSGGEKMALFCFFLNREEKIMDKNEPGKKKFNLC